MVTNYLQKSLPLKFQLGNCRRILKRLNPFSFRADVSIAFPFFKSCFFIGLGRGLFLESLTGLKWYRGVFWRGTVFSGRGFFLVVVEWNCTVFSNTARYLTSVSHS